jgi:hypothetical protein
VRIGDKKLINLWKEKVSDLCGFENTPSDSDADIDTINEIPVIFEIF